MTYTEKNNKLKKLIRINDLQDLLDHDIIRQLDGTEYAFTLVKTKYFHASVLVRNLSTNKIESALYINELN